MKPRRIDAATRASLALLSRWCDWRSCLVVVRPETVLRWHRAGWRLFWRCKSRSGRPPIPMELRQLIRRMAMENPLRGEERIANELLSKLGVRVSPRTVRKYMPKRPPGRPRGDQRWSTFLRNTPRRSLPATSSSRSRRLPTVLCLGSNRAWLASAGALQHHPTSDRGLDAVTTAGGGRLRERLSTPSPRSRQDLCEKLGRIDQESRVDRAQVTAA